MKPTLTGDLVTLRPIEVSDAPGLATLVADPEVVRLAGIHAPFTMEQLERWNEARATRGDRLDLAVVERAASVYAGELVLADLDPPNRSCSLRIALAGQRFFGRGLGTEAIRLALAHVFETVRLHRVELEVYAFNPRARHVYEKVGFVHEGTRREALCWDGQWVDAHVMSMLGREWRRRERA